jgi:uncharacterized DUF497 family protein
MPTEDTGHDNKFEWHENKRRSNIDKHGIDFADAQHVFNDPDAYTYASQHSATEQRHVRVGIVKGICMAVIFTLRGTVVRIISARVARRSERQRYESKG